jgi:hypothetical protein
VQEKANVESFCLPGNIIVSALIVVSCNEVW